MKANLRFFVALGLASTIFFSCDKKKEKDNDDNTLPNTPYTIKAADVQNSIEQIKTVKGISYIQSGEHIIATAEYKDAGFSMELPDTISDDLLFKISEELESSSITVSDSDAKIYSIDGILAYNANGEEIGYIQYDNTDIAGSIWLFSDRDFTISGQEMGSYEDEKYITIFELTIKKGWNEFYSYSSETTDQETGITTYTEKITSSKNPAITLSWRYYGMQAERPATINKKNLFKKIK